MLDTTNGINSDLSYLKSHIYGFFDKIFVLLEKNSAGNLMDAIIANQFGNKEEVLEELGKSSYGPALAEAVDETDKIINDSNHSLLFAKLKERLKVLKGDTTTADEVIAEFIQKYSKPYLTKLFEEKKAVLEEELKPARRTS